MIVFAAIVPHPPFSVPGVGTSEQKKKIKKTLDSFEELRNGIELAKPDTVIIISPHGKMERYRFVINSDPILSGNFEKFGLKKNLEFKNDIGLLNQIQYACRMNDIFIRRVAYEIDHGALVPLSHLLKSINPEVVHMSFSLLTYEKHLMYGEIISNVLRKSKKRIAVIASGDLSHNLIPGSPAGYYSGARNVDRRIIDHLKADDLKALIDMRKEPVRQSCECGVRSILIMMGMIHQKKYKFNMLSYEGPYGVGYLVARYI